MLFENVQSYRFYLGPIWGKLMLMFQKHCNLGIQHIFKANKIEQKSKGHYLGQVGVTIWAKFDATNITANLAQTITPRFLCNFFIQKNVLNPLIL